MIEQLLVALTALFSMSGVLWCCATVCSYLIGRRLQQAAGGKVWLHPMLTTVALLSVILFALQVPITDYRQQVAIIDWLLVMATALLAVPMYQQWQFIKQHYRAIALPLVAGSISGPLIALGILWVFSAPQKLVASSAAKSITSPLAMEVTAMIGGWPDVAAALVILTGLVGAVIGPGLFKLFNIRSDFAQGLAYGTAAHAIGTAAALTKSPRCGAIATVALCVNGVLTVVMLPIIYWLL